MKTVIYLSFLTASISFTLEGLAEKQKFLPGGFILLRVLFRPLDRFRIGGCLQTEAL
jgi:hypothetical protein